MVHEQHASRSHSSLPAAVLAFTLLATGCASPGDTGQTGDTSPASVSTSGPIDSVNVGPTDVAGVYRISPVYDELVEVTVLDVKTDVGRVLSPSEWSFDTETGLITIDGAGRDDFVIARGVRARPWEWRLCEGWMPDTVRALFDDREGEVGKDFELDLERGRLRLLRESLCEPGRDYLVVYDVDPGPGPPGRGRMVSFGNHSDRAAVRRFLGLPEEETAAPGSANRPTIGTNATATEDPSVFRLHREFDLAGMRVGIAQKSDPTRVNWLTSGEQYRYLPNAGEIRLAQGLTVEAADQFLFVSGSLAPKNVIRLQKELVPGSVRVVLGDALLEERVGFRVDHATGDVTILDASFGEPGVSYYVGATTIDQMGLAMGNFGDTERLQQLLNQQ